MIVALSFFSVSPGKFGPLFAKSNYQGVLQRDFIGFQWHVSSTYNLIENEACVIKYACTIDKQRA